LIFYNNIIQILLYVILYYIINMNKTILTICLGLVAGLFGGSLGQSGAELMLPGLLILGIIADFKTAAGTVLLTILPPISLGAIYVYYKRKQIVFKTGLLLIFSYFIAAYFSAKLTKDVSNKTLQFVAGIYFISIGLFMLWNSHTNTFGTNHK